MTLMFKLAPTKIRTVRTVRTVQNELGNEESRPLASGLRNNNTILPFDITYVKYSWARNYELRYNCVKYFIFRSLFLDGRITNYVTLGGGGPRAVPRGTFCIHCS